MVQEENNYAFIDGQNLYRGIKKFGNIFSYAGFRVYLRDVHSVQKACIFLGYMKGMELLYKQLRTDGFELMFKEVTKSKTGTKGNVDVFLTVQSLTRANEYDKAVIVTSDGDFADLIKALKDSNKFKALISPEEKYCSFLLKKQVGGRVTYIKDILQKMQNIVGSKEIGN